MNKEDFTVDLPEEESLRTDKFVAGLGLFSRSQINRRSVRVYDRNQVLLKSSRKLRDGDTVTVEWDDPPSSEILPEELELDIVYEDDNAVVINKAQGIVVHPAQGNFHGTLVQGLLYKYGGIEEVFGGDRVRPGIVHRLDKDTTGLIIAAKKTESLEYLSEQFRARNVKKTYIAILRGEMSREEGEIELPIGRDPRDRKKFAVNTRNSKYAFTRYRVLDTSGKYSLVQIRILTGRTHQIRVHMKAVGTPVQGDPIYTRKDPAYPDDTMMLHSWKLSMMLPGIGKKRFEAPLPKHFKDAMETLGLSLP